MNNKLVQLCSSAGLACLLTISLTATAEEALTRSNGAPVGDNQNSETAGPLGPTLTYPHKFTPIPVSRDNSRRYCLHG